MNVAIRTDASREIGTGHVMRCLTIAEQLRRHGAVVRFVCRTLPGHMCELIEEHGYEVDRLAFSECDVKPFYHDLYARWLVVDQDKDAEQTASNLIKYPNPPDWLIVDHYGLDSQWHRVMRPHTQRIMAIDDLANRSLECDVLLDQNYYTDPTKRYSGLVSQHCRQLIGPEYVLLRNEFFDMKRRHRQGQVKRILVFFGGSDPTNMTGIALNAIAMLDESELMVDVVIGAANPHSEEIRRLCEECDSFRMHQNVSNMAYLMNEADLSLGAGGTATYERLYLQLPTLAVSVADNQIRVLEDLDRDRHLVYLGRDRDMSPESLAMAIQSFMDGKLEIRPYDFAPGSDFLWRELQAAADAQPALAGEANCL